MERTEAPPLTRIERKLDTVLADRVKGRTVAEAVVTYHESYGANDDERYELYRAMLNAARAFMAGTERPER